MADRNVREYWDEEDREEEPGTVYGYLEDALRDRVPGLLLLQWAIPVVTIVYFAARFLGR